MTKKNYHDISLCITTQDAFDIAAPNSMLGTLHRNLVNSLARDKSLCNSLVRVPNQYQGSDRFESCCELKSFSLSQTCDMIRFDIKAAHQRDAIMKTNKSFEDFLCPRIKTRFQDNFMKTKGD